MKETKSFKFLGLIIDNKLNFHEHINYITKKISKNKGVISRVRHLPQEILLKLYYTLIYPYLCYCIELWGSSNSTALNSVFIVQKKVIRVINNLDYFASTNRSFSELKILKLYDIFVYFTCIYFFKIRYCNKSQYLVTNFKSTCETLT